MRREVVAVWTGVINRQQNSRIISTPLRDWSGKLAPFSKPIRFKTNIANWSLAFSHASPERSLMKGIMGKNGEEGQLFMDYNRLHTKHNQNI